VVRFLVYGEARPAGSKRALPVKMRDGSISLRVVHDNPRTVQWMHAVRLAAAEAMEHGGQQPSHAPIMLDIEFQHQRPKAHYRANGLLKEAAPHWKVSRPDLSKLVRAVEDALKGIVWRDDSQVAAIRALKTYGDISTTIITVYESVHR